jgi:hypothetical protein
MRVFLTMAALAVAAIPAPAGAQPPAPPPVELGAQVSKKIDDPVRLMWTGRITLNLSHLTALEGTADVLRTFKYEFEPGTETSARGFGGHWRQTLFTSGRWQVFGVLGAGVHRVKQDYPERIIQGRDGPEVIPAFTFEDSEFVAHLGPAVQVELAPWLALRGDVRLTVGDNNGGVRGMVGGVVPIGRFRAGDRPSGGTPPLAVWQRVKPGREVWVTTASGGYLHGEVASVTNRSLELRQRDGSVTLTLDEIQLVEGRDSLKNGILIGGLAGAAGGATLFTWAASVFCESDPCDPIAAIALVLGAGAGAAVGGLLGAMVDSAIPGKRPLFERGSIRVVPVATRDTKSLNLVVNWR